MTQHVAFPSAVRHERGVALIMALFLVVLLLLVSLAVLANTNNAATGSLSVQTKNQTFNAAEAGLNTAIYQLDENNSLGSGTTDTSPCGVNGYTCHWEVVQNNLSVTNLVSPNTKPDLANSNYTVAIGNQEAYVAGWASSITGGRTVYSELIVKPGPPTTLTQGAITCDVNAQISHEQIIDLTGTNSAHIHCGSIGTNGGGQIPQGNTYAVCNTSGCNQIVGADGQEHIGQSAPTFYTAAQLAQIQQNALTQAGKGAPNVLINGDYTQNGGTQIWGTAGSNCTVYVNGNVTIKGNATLTNYCTTTVITGNFSGSGTSTYSAGSSSTTAQSMFVLGSGGATFSGTGTDVGFVYAANGDITLNGGGQGSYSGSLYTPHSIVMNGGGGAKFYYDKRQIPPPVQSHLVVPVAQWEY